MIKKIALIFIFGSSIAINATGKEKMADLRYNIQMNTQSTYCGAFINGMEIIHNLYGSTGTGSSGAIVNAYLENGENELGIYVTSLGFRKGEIKLREDAKCHVELTLNSPDQQAVVTSVTATPDKDLLPTSETSDYSFPEVRTGKVKEVGPISEGSPIYEMQRPFMIKNMPKWAWVDAKPMPDTRENRKRLKEAYKRIWEVMNAASEYPEDFEKIVGLSMREYAEADGLTPEYMLKSLGFMEDFKDKGFKMLPLKFEGYNYETFRGGRLVRFANANGSSPLRYTISDGSKLRYNPYISDLEKGMTITR